MWKLQQRYDKKMNSVHILSIRWMEVHNGRINDKYNLLSFHFCRIYRNKFDWENRPSFLQIWHEHYYLGSLYSPLFKIKCCKNIHLFIIYQVYRTIQTIFYLSFTTFYIVLANFPSLLYQYFFTSCNTATFLHKNNYHTGTSIVETP